MILRLSVINIVGATVGLLEALVVLVDKIVLSEEQLRTLAWFFEAYACELERQASAVGKPFLLEAARLFAMPIRSAPLQESAARIRQVLSPPPPALKPGMDVTSDRDKAHTTYTALSAGSCAHCRILDLRVGKPCTGGSP